MASQVERWQRCARGNGACVAVGRLLCETRINTLKFLEK